MTHRTPTAALFGAAAAVAAVLLAVLPASPAAAGPQQDKARVDAQLAQTKVALDGATAQVAQALADLATANAQLPVAQQAAAQARGVEAAAQVQYTVATQLATQARDAATRARAKYATAEQTVSRARGELDAFAASAYRQGATVPLASVLEVSNPGQLVNQMGLLEQVGRHNAALVDTFTRARLAAADAKVKANLAAVRADQAQAAAQAAYAQSQAAAKAAEQQAQRVVALVAMRQRAASIAEANRSATLARYADLQAQSQAIEAQLAAIAEAARAAAARAAAERAAQNSGGSAAPATSSGLFIWPVSGFYISDGFGMRFDPYYKVWQLHAGVDLAVGSGTPIHAAAAGTVTYAGWAGGYGNYTCINHGLYNGRGLATCYAHQSAIYVSPGQWVAQGTVIGAVGSTGASTGPHLHFEVRVDGAPTNPLGWL